LTLGPWKKYWSLDASKLTTEKPQFRSRNKLNDEEALVIIRTINNGEYKSKIESDSKITLLEANISCLSE
jgi:hypothetical protein